VVTPLSRDLPQLRPGPESADLLTEMGDYLEPEHPERALDCYLAAWAACGEHGPAMGRLANWNTLHASPEVEADTLLALAEEAERVGHAATAHLARQLLLGPQPTAPPPPPPPPVTAASPWDL
jgi:hypothetical protein